LVIRPREAFLEDLSEEIRQSKAQGDEIVVLLDGNESMVEGRLQETLTQCLLKEKLLECHGTPAATVNSNKQNVPIDRIWCSGGISIKAGGYLPFDAVIPRTNHRTLWIDVSFQNAFGHNMPMLVCPSMRKLQCKDARCIQNFISSYKKFIDKHNLLERAKVLENTITFPASETQIDEYEKLDELRCHAVSLAEGKCRKLKAGQVAFSPTIQLFMRQIRAYNLLSRCVQEKRVSSRYLDRTLRKAQLETQVKNMGEQYLQEQLKQAYTLYY